MGRITPEFFNRSGERKKIPVPRGGPGEGSGSELCLHSRPVMRVGMVSDAVRSYPAPHDSCDDSGFVGHAVTRTRDRLLLFAATSAFGLWLVSVSPLRAWIRGPGHGARWVVGAAPSFFAGLAFALWQAFTTRTTPLVSAGYAVVLIILAETVQLLLPRYTADVWDIAVGVVGAGLGAAVLFWRARRVK